MPEPPTSRLFSLRRHPFLWAMLDRFGWILLGLILDMGVRWLWIHSASGLPNWGGLFVDMTGIAVVGLARGPSAALGVVALNQTYRMALGQVSNAFTPVELAGALFWGWMPLWRWVCLDRRRPFRVFLTWASASLGGGIACAVAAWLTNLILRGQWDFMPMQQELYAEFTVRGALRALPGEVALSVWDKSVTCALALAALGLLSLAGRRIRALAPDRRRSAFHQDARLAASLAATLLWGGFLCARFTRDLLTAPMVEDFLLLRQTLIVSASFLLLAALLVMALSYRKRAGLIPQAFAMAWATLSCSAIVFFLSGLSIAGNLLAGSTYKALWSLQAQLAELEVEGQGVALPADMHRIPLGGPLLEAGWSFVNNKEVHRRVMFGDLSDVLRKVFPGESPGGAPISGYLMGEQGLMVATVVWRRGGDSFCLYQEAPWIFSHGYRDRMVPTASMLLLLTLLVALLFFALGRRMVRTTGEAALGRRARTLAHQVRARNLELEKVQHQLEEAAAQRESRIRELSTLAEIGSAVGILAHEIRNPIGTVQMAFGNLLDALGTDPKGELNEQVLIIERQLRHMNLMTQSVLAFSRSASEGTREGSVASGGAALEACRALSSPLCSRNGIDLRISGPEHDLLLAARENEVIQILQNLLQNAAEAMAELPAGAPRTLTVNLKGEEGNAVFTVSDTGPGIAEASREKIFDLFFTRKIQGAGMGLFIARELARILQGDLAVWSEVGHGTRFELRIPLAK